MADWTRVARANWRTTLMGVATAVMAVADGVLKLLDGNAATNPDWALILAAVMAAIGLVFARDVSVTSKQLGLDDD